MEIRNAGQEDLPLLTKIMVGSFRTAFADFISRATLDACTVEENCLALLEFVYDDPPPTFSPMGVSAC